jgi:hypothetical protein
VLFEKCICSGALAVVKKPTIMPLPLLLSPQPSLITFSPSSSSLILAAPLLENANNIACGTLAHFIAPTIVSSSLMNKPHNLRCERKEEVINSKTALMQHKFMLNFILLSLLTSAMPMLVSEIVSLSEITKA